MKDSGRLFWLIVGMIENDGNGGLTELFSPNHLFGWQRMNAYRTASRHHGEPIAEDRLLDALVTEAELDTLSIKLGTSRDLMAEALLQSAEAAQSKDNTEDAVIAYSIIRERDGKSTEIAADENTPVLPGDVIKVEANLATQ